nr:uncharacterized mitochondrial protein AtMg00810-like [Tanacetum cinerariifolium]
MSNPHQELASPYQMVSGLQLKQKKDGIFISQDKYIAGILRKFGLTKGKSASTPIDTDKPLLKELAGEYCKKQTVVATSSTEAEYVAATSSYDAEGVLCLPNEEIFTGLARIGYEKPSAKLTFYKAFFSSQCRKFNFSKYIFDSLVRNVDSSSKFYMYARVGKGFSGVETPLFKGMLVVQENVVEGIADEQVPDDTVVTAAQEVVTTAVLEDAHDESIPSPALPTLPPQSSQDIPSISQA